MGGYNVFEEPREILVAVKEAGFDGVDVGTAKIGEEEKKNVREIVSLARSLDLEVPAFLGAWAVWHGGEERDLASSDDKVRMYAVNYAKNCVAFAADLGVGTFEVCATPGVNTYPVSLVPVETLRKNFSKSVRDLCEFAVPHNVQIIIEPINRYEGHPGFLNSLAEAAELVESLNIEGLGVLGDLFHMNIEDMDNCEAYRAAGKLLKHIHLADHNRQIPGTGRNNFQAILRTLEDIGFTGYMSLDCVPPKPRALKAFLGESIYYMKAMERANELQKEIRATDESTQQHVIKGLQRRLK
jgi:sugar phosphate isomerase/epimerase